MVILMLELESPQVTERFAEMVYLRFRVTQHEKDRKLLELLINYLGVGRIEDNRKNISTLVIGNFSDLTQIIIPFFNQYSVFGIKHLDYLDWCKIANLMISGKHKTVEGFEEIRRIEYGMNKGRK